MSWSLEKSAQAFAILALLSATEGAAAGSLDEKISQGLDFDRSSMADTSRMVSIKLDPLHIDDRTADAIAAISVSKPVQIAKNTLLRDLVADRCGNVDPAFYRILAQVNSAWDAPEYKPDTELDAGSELNFPVCIPKPTFVVTQNHVSEADSEWKYYVDVDKAFGWSNVIDARATTGYSNSIAAGKLSFDFDHGTNKFVGPDERPIEFRELFAALNGGTPLLAGETKAVPQLPARWISFETKAPADDSELRASAHPSNPTGPFSWPDIPTRLPEAPFDPPPSSNGSADNLADLASLPSALEIDTGDMFEPVFALDTECSHFKSDDAEENELSRILLEVASAIKNRHRNLSSVKVQIIDSGLVAHEGAIVSPDRIATPVAKFGANGVKFDPQGYAPVSAPNVEKYRDHGTRVASLILGGPAFARVLSQLDFDIRLTPTRIYELTEEPQTFRGAPLPEPGKPHKVAIERKGTLKNERILTSLDRNDFDILNLSLGRRDPMDFFIDRFGPNKPALYVVAAGNHKLDLADGDVSFFPASYGGDRLGRDNLISVASIDGDRSLSSFSNYGLGVVDLAAPGCGIPSEAIDFDSDTSFIDKASGTSFSAPQVTFVASLLKAIYHDAVARMIKIRIIQSTDLVPEIAKQVTDGRILNARKALSVFWDVVEVRDDGGSTTLRRGRISPPIKIDQVCSDLKLPKSARLLKVSFGFDGHGANSAKNLVYWLDSADTFKHDVCAASPSEMTLKQPTGQAKFQTSALKDIVMAWEYLQ